jgi:hypothetical protein
MTDFLEPWQAVEDGQRAKLEQELARELPAGHVLAGKAVRAVAARTDRDDVLFLVPDGGCAVVHLTWSGRREASSEWPSTVLYSSLDEWRAGTEARHH